MPPHRSFRYHRIGALLAQFIALLGTNGVHHAAPSFLGFPHIWGQGGKPCVLSSDSSWQGRPIVRSICNHTIWILSRTGEKQGRDGRGFKVISSHDRKIELIWR
ncbi:hypothetical protein F5B20DRAFT_545269 [Whalleya microplaca]|nr:hypothetical protein F5B20DRAFT_545269 [Whalleya microplaca]